MKKFKPDPKLFTLTNTILTILHHLRYLDFDNARLVWKAYKKHRKPIDKAN